MKTTHQDNISILIKKYNHIYLTRCEPCIDAIACILKQMYPKMDDNDAQDWSLDLINDIDNQRVFDMLDIKYKD